MERTVFSEKMAGLTIDEVIRDYEFTMQTKHFHDSFELYFLLEGERYYFIDRETYHVKKGMVVLVNRQQIHKTSLAGKSYHDRILLQISQEGFSPLLEQAGVVPLTRMFEENYGVTELPEKVWEQVKRLLFEIREELREKQGKYDGMVKLKLAEILLLIYRCRRNRVFYKQGGEISTVQTARHQKVHEVADYLLHHYDTDESLEELAERFFISKHHLNKVFRKATGTTVFDYLLHKRITAAQQLLITGYSAQEAASQAGFGDYSSFYRAYTRINGHSPLRDRGVLPSLDTGRDAGLMDVWLKE